MTISIIIPAYQGARYLEKFSLPSLVRQDYPDWEAIVVDDGSTDDTQNILQNWQTNDPRIKYLRHPHNKGLAAALNTGILASHGDYIAFLEQDDIWLSNKLSKQVASLSQAQLCDCSFFWFNENKNCLSGLGAGNFSTLIGRQTVMRKIFPLPENKEYLGIEDGLVAGKLAIMLDNKEISSQDIVHLPNPLAIVSRHSSSLSGHGHSLTYAKRYQAALNFFSPTDTPTLNKLKRSWQVRQHFNLILSKLPNFLVRVIRRLLLLPTPTNCWRFRKTKKQPAYQAAKNIVTNL